MLLSRLRKRWYYQVLARSIFNSMKFLFTLSQLLVMIQLRTTKKQAKLIACQQEKGFEYQMYWSTADTEPQICDPTNPSWYKKMISLARIYEKIIPWLGLFSNAFKRF